MTVLAVVDLSVDDNVRLIVHEHQMSVYSVVPVNVIVDRIVVGAEDTVSSTELAIFLSYLGDFHELETHHRVPANHGGISTLLRVPLKLRYDLCSRHRSRLLNVEHFLEWAFAVLKERSHEIAKVCLTLLTAVQLGVFAGRPLFDDRITLCPQEVHDTVSPGSARRCLS